jgi:pimeloyl-ACP methyl ester carboxylesterase
MHMYADAGNRFAAVEQFHRLGAALAGLGLQPTEETQALYREVLHASPAASPIAYVETGGVHVAYQVVEGGPADLLMIPGWISHLALDWEEPYWVRWCERMTAFARLVRFDKRGTGLSDRPAGVQPLEDRMEDAHAVLNAAGLNRVHVLGWSEGGPLAMLLAATHPERVLSLVLYGTQACFRREPGYPWGFTDEQRQSSSAEVAPRVGDTCWVGRRTGPSVRFARPGHRAARGAIDRAGRIWSSTTAGRRCPASTARRGRGPRCMRRRVVCARVGLRAHGVGDRRPACGDARVRRRMTVRNEQELDAQEEAAARAAAEDGAPRARERVWDAEALLARAETTEWRAIVDVADEIDSRSVMSRSAAAWPVATVAARPRSWLAPLRSSRSRSPPPTPIRSSRDPTTEAARPAWQGGAHACGRLI